MYAASMFLPATGYSIRGSNKDSYILGYEAFEFCFRTLYMDEAWSWERIGCVAAWLANPAFWLAIICLFGHWRFAAILFAGSACILAPCILPGSVAWIVGHSGFWVWWSSMVAALLSALFLLKRSPVPFAEDFGPLKSREVRTVTSS